MHDMKVEEHSLGYGQNQEGKTRRDNGGKFEKHYNDACVKIA